MAFDPGERWRVTPCYTEVQSGSGTCENLKAGAARRIRVHWFAIVTGYKVGNDFLHLVVRKSSTFKWALESCL